MNRLLTQNEREIATEKFKRAVDEGAAPAPVGMSDEENAAWAIASAAGRWGNLVLEAHDALVERASGLASSILHANANDAVMLARVLLDDLGRAGGVPKHEVGYPMYLSERGRWLIECSCGEEHESKSEYDAKLWGKDHEARNRP